LKAFIEMTLKIKNLVLDSPIMQASLSGYTDRPMRTVAREHGAPMTFAGVMLDKAVNHPRVRRRFDFIAYDDEHPIGGQIMGTDPLIMAGAAKGLLEAGYDLVDLNFACPAPKVLRRHRGGYMLNEPDRVIEIYDRVRAAVDAPLTMKLRIGYDETSQGHENFWQICEHAAANGVDGLIIHGRWVQQRYRGRANWEILKKVKEKFPTLPIIGSGDMFEPETVVERLKQTGIDGVTIARGAVGNPWIFREARALLAGEPKPAAPSVKEVGEVLLQHFNRVIDFYHQKKGVAYFRKFAAGYSRRHPERKKVLLILMAAQTADEVRAAIKQWFLS
jgi:nifR3 family TIM-barrel protein